MEDRVDAAGGDALVACLGRAVVTLARQAVMAGRRMMRFFRLDMLVGMVSMNFVEGVSSVGGFRFQVLLRELDRGPAFKMVVRLDEGEEEVGFAFEGKNKDKDLGECNSAKSGRKYRVPLYLNECFEGEILMM